MKSLLFPLFCLFFQCLMAQPDSLFIKEDAQKYNGPQWTQKNKASLDLSEVAFVNWNSGGSNSISGLLGLRSSYDYKDQYFVWKNNALIDYGINKQEKRETRKTDDLLEINSNVGYKPDSLSNWFYSARLKFQNTVNKRI